MQFTIFLSYRGGTEWKIRFVPQLASVFPLLGPRLFRHLLLRALRQVMLLPACSCSYCCAEILWSMSKHHLRRGLRYLPYHRISTDGNVTEAPEPSWKGAGSAGTAQLNPGISGAQRAEDMVRAETPALFPVTPPSASSLPALACLKQYNLQDWDFLLWLESINHWNSQVGTIIPLV